MIPEMRRMRWAPIVIAAMAALAVPAGALGAVLAPPGHAGANQYVEVIPTSRGNAAPPGTVSGSGSSNAGPQALRGLGHGQTGDARLAKLGKEGQSAAALAASTAPSPAPSQHTSPSELAASGGSAPSGIAHVLGGSDSGGLGVLLPLLLATALVLTVGLGIGRLRRRTSPTA